MNSRYHLHLNESGKINFGELKSDPHCMNFDVVGCAFQAKTYIGKMLKLKHVNCNETSCFKRGLYLCELESTRTVIQRAK